MTKFQVVSRALAAGLLMFAVNIPAQAYCCKTNPAICTAVCGQRCCGDSLSSKPKKGAMSTIPADQLKTEADECRGAEPLIKAIDEEMRSRAAGGAAPTATRDPAGAPMPQ